MVHLRKYMQGNCKIVPRRAKVLSNDFGQSLDLILGRL